MLGIDIVNVHCLAMFFSYHGYHDPHHCLCIAVTSILLVSYFCIHKLFNLSLHGAFNRQGNGYSEPLRPVRGTPGKMSTNREGSICCILHQYW